MTRRTNGAPIHCVFLWRNKAVGQICRRLLKDEKSKRLGCPCLLISANIWHPKLENECSFGELYFLVTDMCHPPKGSSRRGRSTPAAVFRVHNRTTSPRLHNGWCSPLKYKARGPIRNFRCAPMRIAGHPRQEMRLTQPALQTE